ncbi:MAG TPA: DUF1330 domain-containing protein [Solirubrobacteraceae bacterium]|nr:DUF1330 domain-containing protein [Solirubrobacteraceae bacterium]
MKVDPTGDDIRGLMEDDDGGPVVMLNLLRYSGEQGRESYRRYGEAAAAFLAKAGGRVLYAGECDAQLAGPDETPAWETLLLVEYPSRTAFVEMVTDPEYQKITPLRSQGLEAAVLHPTRPWASARARGSARA